MFEHRVREFFVQPVATAAAAATAPAFVPCPAFGFPAAQLSFVAEVYRLAREMTEAQLRQPPARVWPPAFSMN